MLPQDKGPLSAVSRIPLQATLKPRWSLDAANGVFLTGRGRVYSPAGQLPRDSRIVHTVPRLAGIPPAQLTVHQRRLQRSIQVLLPAGIEPETYVEVVKSWPCLSDVHVGPRPALPAPSPKPFVPPPSPHQ